MSEKLFVITEVLMDDSIEVDTDLSYCWPVNRECEERMYLHSSRIIPASRLRYGLTKKGETYFAGGWGVWPGDDMGNYERQERERLILDPPEEKDEWREWEDSSPNKYWSSDMKELIEWIKRVPRGEK